MDSETRPGRVPDTVSTLTAPIPILPESVIPTSQSPSLLALWGRRLGPSALTVCPVAIRPTGASSDHGRTHELLDTFTDLGGNLIEVSPGRSVDEVAIAEWLDRPNKRDSVLLASTIAVELDRSNGVAPVIARAVDAALLRLRTDRIDVLSLQLDSEAPQDEALVAIDELIRVGKVGILAAEAPSADRLLDARVTAAQAGITQISAVFGAYSLAARGQFESSLGRVVAQQGLGFLPRAPLAGGFLSGRYRDKGDVRRAERGSGMARQLTRKGFGILAALDRVAGEHDATDASIALAWLLTRPSVVAPIVSVNRVDQVADVIAAIRLQLTRHQVADLDRASRPSAMLRQG